MDCCGSMTVEEYLTQRFGAMGYTPTAADLLDISLLAGVPLTELYTSDNMELVGLGVCQYIPQLMAHPQSISESGFSISWDTAAMLKWYSALCKRYGLDDELTDSPRVSFL